MSFRRTAVTLGSVASAVWGTTIVLGAVASAPVTAPIAAAGGTIIGVGLTCGLFGGRDGSDK